MSGPDFSALPFYATDCAVIELAAFKGRFAALCDSLGLPVLAPGKVAAWQEHTVLAHRPDRLLLLAERPPVLPELAGMAAIIDLSSARRLVLLDRPDARAILLRGCRMDLRDAAFGASQGAMTLFGQVPVILICDRPGSAYRLLVDRSLEEVLLHGLSRAAIALVSAI